MPEREGNRARPELLVPEAEEPLRQGRAHLRGLRVHAALRWRHRAGPVREDREGAVREAEARRATR